MSPHQGSSKRNRGARGFTLVETLVALVLLTVGLVPAFILANSAIGLANSVRNRLVVTSLAQEGVEMVRAIRDANWLANPQRLYHAGLTSGAPNCLTGCRVEWNNEGTLSLAGNPTLKFDPLTGIYQYAGPKDSGFTRLVVVTDVSNHQMKVIVTMGWKERSGNKTLALEYYLYDWLQ